jgi:hypothetical protein
MGKSIGVGAAARGGLGALFAQAGVTGGRADRQATQLPR